MEADQQLDGVNSIESYTRTWTQMIDRGGLYQVKDDVSIKGIFMVLYNTLLTIIIISVSGLHTCGINWEGNKAPPPITQKPSHSHTTSDHWRCTQRSEDSFRLQGKVWLHCQANTNHTALSYCEQLLHYGQTCTALHLLRDGMNNSKRNSTNMLQEAL